MSEPGNPCGGCPLAAPESLAAAEGWLGSRMEALGRPLIGPARLVHAWELSSVLRAPVAGGTVYLKATAASPLLVDEGVVTRTLAELFPGRVPAPLAVDAGRRWMAMDDFGEVVGWRVPAETREEVVRCFARLQVEAVPHVRRLLRAGCLDRRLGWLAGQASSWLPAIEETGRLPGIDRGTWLRGAELAELRAAVPRLTAMCAELATFRVPASLVHGDLHLGNVAVAPGRPAGGSGATGGPGGYRFFDWTDACVAHPFVDLLTFVHDDEDDDADDAPRARVRDAYLAEWTRFEPADRLRRAWRLAAPLGALHHALSYRSIVANLAPPVEEHLARSTAYWLRRLLAELRPPVGDQPELAGRLRTTRPRC